MNILDRLNTIIEKEALGDVRNTVVDISPEAFGLLISQHAVEIGVSEGIRARQAQPVDVRFFTWILESDRFSGDEFAVHLQLNYILTANMCESAHERLWWLSQSGGEMTA
jgi:hypothetical protein